MPWIGKITDSDVVGEFPTPQVCGDFFEVANESYTLRVKKDCGHDGTALSLQRLANSLIAIMWRNRPTPGSVVYLRVNDVFDLKKLTEHTYARYSPSFKKDAADALDW